MNTSGDPGQDLKNIKEETEQKNSQFIQEQLKSRPLNRRKLLRRLGVTALMAVVFGVVACIVFVGIERLVNRTILPEKSIEAVTVPEDSAEEEMSPEEMVATEEESELNRISEIDASIRSYFSSNRSGLSEYSSMYTALRSYVRTQSMCIAEIEGISASSNWMTEQLENSNSVSGVVVSKSTQNIDILAGADFSDADRILVSFRSGASAQAQLLGYNEAVGISILRVLASDLTTEQVNAITEANIAVSGSSYAGKPIIAIGSPTGTSGSLYYGIISGTRIYNEIADSEYTIVETDICSAANASGVLCDLDGRVIGLIKMSFQDASRENVLSAIELNGLENLIEELSEEKEPAYFGIRGTDVPSSFGSDDSEESISSGAYVIQSLPDSPAVSAGIQNGDVITAWGLDSITRYSQLVKKIQEASPGDQIRITYKRYYDDAWHEMHTTCILE